MKPITSTAIPTASQPARQPLCRIAVCAISGRMTSPAICAIVAIAVAKVRREMNQLFTAPYMPRSNGPAKFVRATQNSR